MNRMIIIISLKTNLSLDLRRGPGGENIKILPLSFQSKLFIFLITNFSEKILPQIKYSGKICMSSVFKILIVAVTIITLKNNENQYMLQNWIFLNWKCSALSTEWNIVLDIEWKHNMVSPYSRRCHSLSHCPVFVGYSQALSQGSSGPGFPGSGGSGCWRFGTSKWANYVVREWSDHLEFTQLTAVRRTLCRCHVKKNWQTSNSSEIFGQLANTFIWQSTFQLIVFWSVAQQEMAQLWWPDQFGIWILNCSASSYNFW